MPATRQQKHEAGRHLVVGEALLRGYDAHTIGPTRLVEVNGHRATVHVKTQTGLVHADGAHCWEHLLDPPTTAPKTHTASEGTLCGAQGRPTLRL